MVPSFLPVTEVTVTLLHHHGLILVVEGRSVIREGVVEGRSLIQGQEEVDPGVRSVIREGVDPGVRRDLRDNRDVGMRSTVNDAGGPEDGVLPGVDGGSPVCTSQTS